MLLVGALAPALAVGARPASGEAFTPCDVLRGAVTALGTRGALAASSMDVAASKSGG